MQPEADVEYPGPKSAAELPQMCRNFLARLRGLVYDTQRVKTMHAAGETLTSTFRGGFTRTEKSSAGIRERLDPDPPSP